MNTSRIFSISHWEIILKYIQNLKLIIVIFDIHYIKSRQLSKLQISFLHSMGEKSTFHPYCVKKNYSTHKMETFKVMLLIFYLASLDQRPRTYVEFKSLFLDIEITIVAKIPG